jgi:hypothetical protein
MFVLQALTLKPFSLCGLFEPQKIKGEMLKKESGNDKLWWHENFFTATRERANMDNKGNDDYAQQHVNNTTTTMQRRQQLCHDALHGWWKWHIVVEAVLMKAM